MSTASGKAPTHTTEEIKGRALKHNFNENVGSMLDQMQSQVGGVAAEQESINNEEVAFTKDARGGRKFVIRLAHSCGLSCFAFLGLFAKRDNRLLRKLFVIGRIRT